MVFNFHAGKLEVQSRAGTTEEAARILNAGWIGTAISSSGESQIADTDMKEVYLSSVDLEGRVWASVVVGEKPGFVEVSQSPSDQDALEVSIDSGDRGYLTYKGDPLDENIRRSDAPVGMLIMGYKNRRRYRMDGRIVSTTSSASAGAGTGGAGGAGGSTDDSALDVDRKDPALVSRMKFVITMAMGNCPKYLHIRDLVGEEQATPVPPIKRSTALSKEQRDWIASSATFTLGTYAGGQNGGADASNRGGTPGFIKALDEHTIVFPDYKGNNLYLSLGNIAASAKAGLLFINRGTGDVLQVSGEAHIMWEEDEGVSGINAGATTGKHIRIDVLSVVEAKGANPLRMKMKELSPFNPPLPVPPELSGDGFGDGAERQQRQTDNHLMRCSEVLDVAAGVKSFRFQPSTALGGGGDAEKLLTWTPGQYATFFFPSCEGVGCGAIHHGLYTLPVLVSPEGARQAGAGDEPVVRTWTITSVHGDGGPLEITVQAKEGGVSEHMHSYLKAGDLVRLAVGGDFTLTDRMGAPPSRDSKVLLLSAGIGVTPMIGALRWLKQREGKRCSDPNRCVVPAHPDVVAIHATRSEEAVPYLSEIIHQATRKTADTQATSTSTNDDATRVRFVLAITRTAVTGRADGSTVSTAPQETLSGNKRGISTPDKRAGGGAASDFSGVSIVQGRPDAIILKREVPDVAERHVLLCGPDAFMVAMDGLLRGLGVASSRIHSEEFYF